MLKLLVRLLSIVAIVAALHFRWDLFRRRFHPWLERNATLLGAYRSLGWLLTVPLILVGGYLGFLQLRDALGTPDVALLFGNPDKPLFWVMNSSSKLVREPKYHFLLYDLSLPGNQELHLNLEIPTKILDFIRPGQAFGPWTIKSLAGQGSRIEKGHHLFRYAQVQCPTCEQVHFYWIFWFTSGVQGGTLRYQRTKRNPS
jgi:hypothetical protein